MAVKTSKERIVKAKTPCRTVVKKVPKSTPTLTINKPYKRLHPDRRVIHHLTQTDAYKYSMGQFYFHRYPTIQAEWEFHIRTRDIDVSYLYDDIVKEIDHLCTLRYTQWELDGIGTRMPWIAKDYIDHLEGLQLKRKYITIDRDPNEQGGIRIRACGPQYMSFWFEIYVLQIVQHLYFDDEEINWDVAKANLDNVIEKWNAAWREGLRFTVSDFGIRRSISDEWNEYMVTTMKKYCPAFVGTSNVYLAIKCDTKAIGTFAHELFATYQGIKDIPLRMAQQRVLEDWAKEFHGDLGVALSDNYGFLAFLRDFDKYYAKLFDGARHDSGDPIKWGELLIAHYKRLGIDPTTKVACWSDSLDADKALEIARHFNGRIKIAFGIGTFLCATILGMKKDPISMVMKTIRIKHGEMDWVDVAKVSDSAGKGMCHSQKRIDLITDTFRIISIDDLSFEECQIHVYGQAA